MAVIKFQNYAQLCSLRSEKPEHTPTSNTWRRMVGSFQEIKKYLLRLSQVEVDPASLDSCEALGKQFPMPYWVR